jgi:hypothetical protein
MLLCIISINAERYSLKRLFVNKVMKLDRFSCKNRTEELFKIVRKIRAGKPQAEMQRCLFW